MTTQEIWIYAEKHIGIIQPVTYQLITKAKEIAGDKKVVVILFEATDKNLEENIKEYGPDEIVVVKDDRLKDAMDSEVASLMAELAKRRQPNSILFGATVVGRSIAPRLQAKLNTGLTSDCLNLSFDSDLLVQTKPSYGDNIMCEIICPNHRPQMASVRPNTFEAKKINNATVTVTEVNDLAFKEAKRVKIIEETPLLSKSDSIANADRVIAIGRGAVDDKTVELAEELARKLGAKIGVTRPLTDHPKFNGEDQIGQSGNTIAPKLLINLGIHGAVQYTTGIGNAELVVSINKDPEAPIFDHSDYSYIGDSASFLEGFLKVVQ
ncbi:electron transfer flavoprotein subunit alpha/FixB family protein [Carnobacterium viridans]|uniref:Electron transfer flavoprotein alpha subunit apoprotein n=1 Tax=Carnobacterium viridans TaxID=174587 RepID=A0A1H0ZDQ7_9LACT|nr:electron transfer flavoprotein subunit alpha/FixB family protein [Carnobacterium viridans]UDE94693.1 electron transfer flavoprotein subunit alpha/FixB family protein [Carnobacterium viridans]SDQ25246.1 electron transfer flavoprotein alpha subunit apoprotein [Carnobacterium viridans]